MALWQQIADMPQEKRDELVNKIGAVVSCTGRPLSGANTMLLFLQNPRVSVIGGFRQWQDAGRAVRKGEKGLSIWVPKTYEGTTEPAPSGVLCLPAPGAGSFPEAGATASTDGNRSRFILGTVFDISQTDPIEGTTAPAETLPALETTTLLLA